MYHEWRRMYCKLSPRNSDMNSHKGCAHFEKKSTIFLYASLPITVQVTINIQGYDYSLLRKYVFGSVFSAQEKVRNCHKLVFF
jgi:hypothetical protein